MPIYWLIDSRSRRVVVTAEGKVTRAEFEEYLEAVTGAGANSYGKIFDGTRGENAMAAEDMAALAARFRQLHAQPHGPLAICWRRRGASSWSLCLGHWRRRTGPCGFSRASSARCIGSTATSKAAAAPGRHEQGVRIARCRPPAALLAHLALVARLGAASPRSPPSRSLPCHGGTAMPARWSV